MGGFPTMSSPVLRSRRMFKKFDSKAAADEQTTGVAFLTARPELLAQF